MALDTGINLLETIFFKTSFAGQYWIMQLTIVLATLALLTRKTNDWKTLGLPVLLGWQTFGIKFPLFFYTIAVIMFILDIMSMKTLESAIGTVSETLGIIRKEGGIRKVNKNRKILREAERMNIREQMESLKANIEDKDVRTQIKNIERYKLKLGTIAGKNQMDYEQEGKLEPQKIIQYASKNNAIVQSNLSKLAKAEEEKENALQLIYGRMQEGIIDKNYIPRTKKDIKRAGGIKEAPYLLNKLFEKKKKYTKPKNNE